ncbi:Glycosyl hydrolase family 92, partial [Popillia japonica]
ETNFETVAKGLEFALADWCIAQVAKKLNKSEDYERLISKPWPKDWSSRWPTGALLRWRRS